MCARVRGRAHSAPPAVGRYMQPRRWRRGWPEFPRAPPLPPPLRPPTGHDEGDRAEPAVISTHSPALFRGPKFPISNNEPCGRRRFHFRGWSFTVGELGQDRPSLLSSGTDKFEKKKKPKSKIEKQNSLLPECWCFKCFLVHERSEEGDNFYRIASLPHLYPKLILIGLIRDTLEATGKAFVAFEIINQGPTARESWRLL